MSEYLRRNLVPLIVNASPLNENGANHVLDSILPTIASEPTPFPISVRIGPYKYRVEFVDRISLDDTELVGEIRYGEERIMISATETPIGRWDTLIHEIIHGVSRLLPENLQLSEAHVQALTPYLTSFLLDSGLVLPQPLTEEEQRKRLELIEVIRKDNANTVDGC